MTLLDTKGNTTLSAGNLTAKEGKWDIGNALTGKGIASLDSNGNVVYQMETTNVKLAMADRRYQSLRPRSRRIRP